MAQNNQHMRMSGQGTIIARNYATFSNKALASKTMTGKGRQVFLIS